MRTLHLPGSGILAIVVGMALAWVAGIDTLLAAGAPVGAYDLWTTDVNNNIVTLPVAGFTYSSGATAVTDPGFRQEMITDDLSGATYIHLVMSQGDVATESGKSTAESFVRMGGSGGIASRQTMLSDAQVVNQLASQAMGLGTVETVSEINKGDFYDPNREVYLFARTDQADENYFTDFTSLRAVDAGGNDFVFNAFDQNYRGTTPWSGDEYTTTFYYRDKDLPGVTDKTIEFTVLGFHELRPNTPSDPSQVNPYTGEVMYYPNGFFQRINYERRAGAAVPNAGGVVCRADPALGNVGDPSVPVLNWNANDMITMKAMDSSVLGGGSYGHYFFEAAPDWQDSALLDGFYPNRTGIYAYDGNWPYCNPVTDGGYDPFVVANPYHQPIPYVVNPLEPLNPDPYPADTVNYSAVNPFDPNDPFAAP